MVADRKSRVQNVFNGSSSVLASPLEALDEAEFRGLNVFLDAFSQLPSNFKNGATTFLKKGKKSDAWGVEDYYSNLCSTLVLSGLDKIDEDFVKAFLYAAIWLHSGVTASSLVRDISEEKKRSSEHLSNVFKMVRLVDAMQEHPVLQEEKVRHALFGDLVQKNERFSMHFLPNSEDLTKLVLGYFHLREEGVSSSGRFGGSSTQLSQAVFLVENWLKTGEILGVDVVLGALKECEETDNSLIAQEMLLSLKMNAENSYFSMRDLRERITREINMRFFLRDSSDVTPKNLPAPER